MNVNSYSHGKNVVGTEAEYHRSPLLGSSPSPGIKGNAVGLTPWRVASMRDQVEQAAGTRSWSGLRGWGRLDER